MSKTVKNGNCIIYTVYTVTHTPCQHNGSNAFELNFLVFLNPFGNELLLFGVHEVTALSIGNFVAMHATPDLGCAVSLQTVGSDDELPLAIRSFFEVTACTADSTFDGVLQASPLRLTEAETVAVTVRTPACIGLAQPLALRGRSVESLHDILTDLSCAWRVFPHRGAPEQGQEP